jgi:uncharacterized protein (DUF433 family)
MADWRKFIEASRETPLLDARFKGSGLPVSVVLARVAAGLSPDEIAREFPAVTSEGVLAALAYASQFAQWRTVSTPS